MIVTMAEPDCRGSSPGKGVVGAKIRMSGNNPSLRAELTLPARRRGGDGAAGGPRDFADVVEVDLGHRQAERARDAIGEVGVAREIVAHTAAPGGDAAARMQL